MYEFETTWPLIEQEAILEILYSVDHDKDERGEYFSLSIDSVIWKQKHDKHVSGTGTVRSFNNWTYMDITEMLLPVSLNEIEKEAHQHYEQWCAPDYGMKEKSTPVFAGYALYHTRQHLLDEGQQLWQNALELFDRCWTADHWPGYDDLPLMQQTAPRARDFIHTGEVPL